MSANRAKLGFPIPQETSIMDRATVRALADAGYMPLHLYGRRPDPNPARRSCIGRASFRCGAGFAMPVSSSEERLSPRLMLCARGGRILKQWTPANASPRMR